MGTSFRHQRYDAYIHPSVISADADSHFFVVEIDQIDIVARQILYSEEVYDDLFKLRNDMLRTLVRPFDCRSRFLRQLRRCSLRRLLALQGSSFV
ncbi:MAG: hypothetical protein ACTTH9_00725 [Porphyromonas gingivalis]